MGHEDRERHGDHGDDGEHGDHGDHGDRGHHDHHEHHAQMVADFRRRFWISIAATLPIAALSPTIQGWLGLGEALAFPGDGWVRLALATGVFLYGGWPFLKGLVEELGDRKPGMMTLIGLALVVAYGYSAAVTLGLDGQVFFWELAALMPSEAHRLGDDGGTEDVPVGELREGDRVQVRPGEKVPADGAVVEGRSSVDVSALTGESEPVPVGEGDEVMGAAVNGEAALVVRVERTGEESYLSRVVALVRGAQESRSRSQHVADRAAVALTVVALAAGGITLAVWWGLVQQPFDSALERMVTVMVITCPHALGLAVPLVMAVSTATAARNGLLVRDREAFERAREVDAVVFDKTGTLTEGRFGVERVDAAEGWARDDVLRLAAAVEAASEHPVGRGIVDAAAGDGLDGTGAEGFEALPGQGVRATVEGREVAVVRPAYLREHELGAGAGEDFPRRARERGRTVVHVLADGEPAGAIALADVVRAGSREAVEALRGAGLRVLLITGDADAVGRAVADELGLDEVFTEVLPGDKADHVRRVQERGLRVAMVGDGVNDAPALARADLGIAIGAGTDVAAETADVVLVDSDPRDVSAVLELARATRRKVVQNLAWATGYNAIAIPLAAGVLVPVGISLSPAAGAALMAVSTVVVAINARLLDDPTPHGAGRRAGGQAGEAR